MSVVELEDRDVAGRYLEESEIDFSADYIGIENLKDDESIRDYRVTIGSEKEDALFQIPADYKLKRRPGGELALFERIGDEVYEVVLKSRSLIYDRA